MRFGPDVVSILTIFGCKNLLDAQMEAFTREGIE